MKKSNTTHWPHSLAWVPLIPVARQGKMTGDEVRWGGWPGLSTCPAILIMRHNTLLENDVVPDEPSVGFFHTFYQIQSSHARLANPSSPMIVTDRLPSTGLASQSKPSLKRGICCHVLTPIWSHRWELHVRFGPRVVISPKRIMIAHTSEVLPISDTPYPPTLK